MYSKDEASQLKQSFWTTFGQYISPQLSAEGHKINWINYKTGIKHLSFRMHADGRSAFIAIEMSHNDLGMQELMFEQFLELRVVMKEYLGEEWDWELHVMDENGKTVSRISKSLKSVSIFNKDDWPQLISFFKPRMIALDEFWEDAKYTFETFR